MTNFLEKYLKQGNFQNNEILCQLKKLVCSVTSANKKDYEPLVLCDIATGEPVIQTYTFDDTGLLVQTNTNVDGTPFLGTVGKCPNKNYGITSKEWFCVTSTQESITREDIVNLDDNTTIASLWRDKLGNILTSPLANDITVGVCAIACTPNISSATANDLSTLTIGHQYDINNPTCCSLNVITSIGTHLIPKKGSYSSPKFECTFSITEITSTENCDLSKIIINLNKIK